MPNPGTCNADWSLFVIKPQIPAELLSEALKMPSAIRLAYDMGILEILGLSLTVLGVVIALAAFLGGWIVRREAIAVAKSAAEGEIPAEVLKYMKQNINIVMRECFKDPELVSTIQATLMRLGIRDAQDAYDVDTDAENKETVDDGYNGKA